MKNLIYLLLAAAALSCNTPQWDKATAKKAFMDQLPKEQAKNFTPQMVDKLCNCMAGKVVAKYKSMSEANSDLEGMRQIGTDCGKELVKGMVTAK
jgi:hypothetical protein